MIERLAEARFRTGSNYMSLEEAAKELQKTLANIDLSSRHKSGRMEFLVLEYR